MRKLCFRKSKWLSYSGGWTDGTCSVCNVKFVNLMLRRGVCQICHQPESRRELVRHGIPIQSCVQLVCLLGKVTDKYGPFNKPDEAAEYLLTMTHPILMENLKVAKGVLRVKDKRLVWVRRKGWAKRGENYGL